MNILDGVPSGLGKIAVTIGSFDGVHRGHRKMLDRLHDMAARAGARGVVLTFDPHPREYFSPESAPPLLTTLQERADLLAAAGVDVLVRIRFDERLANTEPREFVRDLLMPMGELVGLVVGYDFRFGRGRRGDAALLSEMAAAESFELEVVEAGSVDGIIVKSTRVREAVAAGDVALAARLLGHDYFVVGRVVHGAGRGRRLGFSTANLEPFHPRKLLPPDGVYAVWVRGAGCGDDAVRGVANLGRRPTFGSGERLLEVHLLEGEPDLYGSRLDVAFAARLRDERAFGSKEDLIAQISKDVETARALLAPERPSPSGEGAG